MYLRAQFFQPLQAGVPGWPGQASRPHLRAGPLEGGPYYQRARSSHGGWRASRFHYSIASEGYYENCPDD